MKQYIVKGQQGNEFALIYNKEGVLCEFRAGAGIGTAALQWMLHHLPKGIGELKALHQQSKGMEVTEIPMDLTFERFWTEYDHKIGSKGRAQKLWEKMSDSERVDALMAIPLYNRYLKVKSGIEKAYAETWLHNRRWENVYK